MVMSARPHAATQGTLQVHQALLVIHPLRPGNSITATGCALAKSSIFVQITLLSFPGLLTMQLLVCVLLNGHNSV